MKKIILPILIISIAIILGATALTWFNLSKNQLTRPKYQTITINGQTIQAEVAINESERSKGLSGREELKDGFGMLFIFEQPAQYGFWMKEMNFPIDIIWISDNNIVDLDENLAPEGSEPKITYQPDFPVNYVLEVPAGFIRENQIKIGDRLEIKTQ